MRGRLRSSPAEAVEGASYRLCVVARDEQGEIVESVRFNGSDLGQVELITDSKGAVDFDLEILEGSPPFRLFAISKLSQERTGEEVLIGDSEELLNGTSTPVTPELTTTAAQEPVNNPSFQIHLAAYNCGCDPCQTTHEKSKKGSNPVMLHNGGKHESRTDLVLPGRGVHFAFSRTYKSYVRYDGPMGQSWTHSYDMRLTQDAVSGDVSWLTGSSRKETFESLGGGAFRAPTGYYLRLDLDAGAEGTLRLPNGMRYRFRALNSVIAPGAIASISDRFGNTLRFFYGSSGPELSRLTRVLDAYGRPVELHYNGQGRIRELRDYLGRSVTYTYGSVGDLIKVTSPAVTSTTTGQPLPAAEQSFPDGKSEIYAYQNGYADERLNHLLILRVAPNQARHVSDADLENLAVLRPLARTETTYDLDPRSASFGRVVKQRWGGSSELPAWTGQGEAQEAGGVIQFSYRSLNTSPNPSLNEPVEVTTTIDRNGNRVETFHNSAGQCVRQRVYTNRNVRPESTAPGEGEDPEFFERTWVYNADGLLLAHRLPMGGVTRRLYGDEDHNGDGLLTPGEDRNNDGDFDDPEDVQPEDDARYAFEPGNGTLDRLPRFGQRNLLRLERYPDARGDTRGGQRPRISTFRYEPIYNALAAATDPRAYDPDYTPQNGGFASLERYTTRRFFDYQQGPAAVTLPALAAETGLGETELTQLLGQAGVQLGLGDLNESLADDGRTTGNVIRVEAPTVNLTPTQTFVQAVQLDTTQEIVSLAEFNAFGQPIRTVDAERNVHSVSYYDEETPDGGGASFRDPSYPAPVAGGGYPRTVTTDSVEGDPRRNSGKDPSAVRITRHLEYDVVGNVIRVIDPRGIAHSLDVNPLNQVVRATAASDTSVLDPSEPGPLLAFSYESLVFHDDNNNVVETRIENAGERDGTDVTVSTNPYWTRKVAYDLLDQPVFTLAEVEPLLDDAALNVSTPGVIVTRMAYDPNQNLIRVIKPEGNQIAFLYDERDLLFQTIDGYGSADAGTVTRHYDLNGNLLLVVDAKKHNLGKDPAFDGDVTRFILDGFNELSCTIDPEGNFGLSVFDPTGARVRYVRFGPPEEGTPRLSETEYLHDELGRTFQVEARIFSAPYRTLASLGGLPTEIPVLGEALPPGEQEAVSLAEFDALGRVVRSVDPKGDDSLVCYDGAGRVTQLQGPEFRGLTAGPVRNEVNLTYNQASQVVRANSIDRAPTGATENFTSLRVYDAIGRLVRATDPAGQTARMAYDSRSNVIAVSDAKSASLIADPLGLYTAGLINVHGNVSHVFYDGVSRPVRSERLLQQGGVGNGSLHLLSRTNLDTSNSSNPDGLITVANRYDRNSRLVTKTDDNGNVTRWLYDQRDRVTSVGAADRTHTFTQYDADSLVERTLDRNGTAISHTYDGLGRLLRRTATQLAMTLEGTSQNVEGTTVQAFEYDGLSRLRVSSDNNRDDVVNGPDDVVCGYEYDSLSRTLTEQHQFRVQAILSGGTATNNRISVVTNSTSLVRTVRSEFDLDSNRTALTYSSGRRLEFVHDGLDRVQQIVDQSVGGLPVQQNEFIGARPLTCRAGNGIETRFGYDLKRRVQTIDHTQGANLVAGFGYTWGRADNRATETRAATPATGGLPQETESYDYDSAYRLTRVGYSNGRADTTWLLDGVGNWVERIQDGERLEVNRRQNGTPGGGSYVGDLMNEYSRIARFDASGSLVSDEAPTHDANGNRIEDGKHRLFFDLFDRLVRVERTSDGATIGTYHYDAASRRVHKAFLDPATGAADETFFVCDGAREIEELDASGGVKADFVYGDLYIDQVVQVRRDSGGGLETLYLHANSLFSVAAVTNSLGAVVERYDYTSAYGEVRATDASGAPRSAAAEVGNPWRFTGRRLDRESGLYHYRMRYYDAGVGRFVSRDPVGIWGDPGQKGNAQSYCGNNPVNRTDPTGLLSPDDQYWEEQEARLGYLLNHADELGLSDAAYDRLMEQYISAGDKKTSSRIRTVNESNGSIEVGGSEATVSGPPDRLFIKGVAKSLIGTGYVMWLIAKTVVVANPLLIPFTAPTGVLEGVVGEWTGLVVGLPDAVAETVVGVSQGDPEALGEVAAGLALGRMIPGAGRKGGSTVRGGSTAPIQKAPLNPAQTAELEAAVDAGAKQLGVEGYLHGNGVMPDARISAPGDPVVHGGTVGATFPGRGIVVDQAIHATLAEFAQAGAPPRVGLLWSTMELSDRVAVTLVHEAIEFEAMQGGMSATAAHAHAVATGAGAYAPCLTPKQLKFLAERAKSNW